MSQMDDSKITIRRKFRAYLFVEEHGFDALANWCRKSYPHLESCREFRDQLWTAIEHPGTITPQIYETWTFDDSFTTQEEVQAHLKKVWSACFPDEALV